MHRQEEGGNREQGPGREGSPGRGEGPVREESPVRGKGPLREGGPVREGGAVREEGPVREGPVRGEGPVREGPVTEPASVRERGPFQERGGARGGRPGRDAPSGRGEPPGRDEGDGRDGHAARAAELLRRAVAYALGAAQTVTPALLARPTPCAQWDLGRLLAHADDSLAALHEGFTDGAVALCPPPRPVPAPREATRDTAIRGATAYDPAAAFRLRAARALGVLSGVRAGSGPPRPRQPVVVADAPLTATALALAGAVELAVHGWDISRAAGRPDHVLPLPLAARLLPVAHRLVPHEGARHPLFGPPVALNPSAPPDHRLLAFLGRDPRPPDTAARRR